jgi:hypothetical protein
MPLRCDIPCTRLECTTDRMVIGSEGSRRDWASHDCTREMGRGAYVFAVLEDFDHQLTAAY